MRNEDHFFGLNKEKSFKIQAHAHRVSGTYYGISTRMTILTQNFLNSIRNMVNFELCNEIEKDGFSS